MSRHNANTPPDALLGPIFFGCTSHTVTPNNQCTDMSKKWKDRLQDPALKVTMRDHATYPWTFSTYLYCTRELHNGDEKSLASGPLHPLRGPSRSGGREKEARRPRAILKGRGVHIREVFPHPPTGHESEDGGSPVDLRDYVGSRNLTLNIT